MAKLEHLKNFSYPVVVHHIHRNHKRIHWIFDYDHEDHKKPKSDE
jgi:hypothetical protein